MDKAELEVTEDQGLAAMENFFVTNADNNSGKTCCPFINALSTQPDVC
jgi:hypothetical protein